MNFGTAATAEEVASSDSLRGHSPERATRLWFVVAYSAQLLFAIYCRFVLWFGTACAEGNGRRGTNPMERNGYPTRLSGGQFGYSPYIPSRPIIILAETDSVYSAGTEPGAVIGHSWMERDALYVVTAHLSRRCGRYMIVDDEWDGWRSLAAPGKTASWRPDYVPTSWRLRYALAQRDCKAHRTE